MAAPNLTRGAAAGGAAANPAALFYAASPLARALGAGLRALDRIVPAWGARGALRLFFTPLPWKLAARRRLPDTWRVERWPFERTEIAAYRRTDLEPGRPVVLLVHGWAGHAMQMHGLAQTLAAQGFDPVLLDFPGHGRSGAWRSTLPQFARALHVAASRLGPLHGLVAHSLGAVSALHAAARGLAVRRLVLIAPAAPPAQFLGWFAGSFGLDAGLPARMRRRIEVAEAVDLAEFEPEWLGARIGQPCLVVHDEGDRVAPVAAGERVVAALHDARLHTTRGLGHRRVLDDAEVARVVAAHLSGVDAC